MLTIRKAAEADFERIMEIYGYAQEQMIRSGNPGQWGHFYPPAALIENDIRTGVYRVICDEQGIRGVFALLEGEEPTYRHIEGAWLNDGPYVTIHRIAGDGRAHGLFRCAAEYSVSICPNVRIDTHADNAVMRRLIEKNGFRECGVIYVEDGTPRLAYQRAEERTPE